MTALPSGSRTATARTAPRRAVRSRAGLLRRTVKRTIDLTGASAGLVLLSPLLLVTAVAIVTTSRGSPVFRQWRVGRDESRFVLYKFRTMRTGCPDDVHRAYVSDLLTAEHELPVDSYKLLTDDRITAVGRFLRRWSLDELPQLVNVVLGQMSLVGPRPALPWEAELFQSRHRARFAVRPGLTGLWQVSGRSRLSPLQSLDLDVDYVDRWSLWLDVEILARTVPAMLRRDGAG